MRPRPLQSSMGAMDREAPTSTHRPRIVVGYDGSTSSRLALEEAARRAGADGHLYVVHAFHAPGEQYGQPNSGAKLAEEQERARRVLAELDADAVEWLAGGRWESELLAGPPAEAIVRVAAVRDADEIYIGSRGVGRARALLGSVAHDVLHRADRPVVVIPEAAVERSASAATAS
jgi:nucleotide-binding universal stress UspA family protein